ncbi:pyridoxal phosphate-dependent transferase [Haematococcus lacustris]
MVLVDAAAYAPTQPLDLSSLQADFVDIAFYKMFGYPTGLGALLVRTEAMPLMQKVFWGGGSIALATSSDNFHVFKCKPSEKMEDGTVSFLDIISLKHGFAQMDKLGGITRIQAHVGALTAWLYTALTRLTHSNGQPMVKVFGKHQLPNAGQVQGGIVNFEVLGPQGDCLSYRRIEREAAAAGFHLRTGAECNPGACYAYLGVAEAEVEGLAGIKEGCGDDIEFIRVLRPQGHQGQVAAPMGQQGEQVQAENGWVAPGPPPTPGGGESTWVRVPLGSVRVSLGWMSSFEDVFAFTAWLQRSYRDAENLVEEDSTVTLLPRE